MRLSWFDLFALGSSENEDLQRQITVLWFVLWKFTRVSLQTSDSECLLLEGLHWEGADCLDQRHQFSEKNQPELLWQLEETAEEEEEEQMKEHDEDVKANLLFLSFLSLLLFTCCCL